MNEQNLPKNTKKEVKETAVPVVSNDPQEVNNDSPPKLKEDTGSKGKTNSNEASKSDISATIPNPAYRTMVEQALRVSHSSTCYTIR